MTETEQKALALLREVEDERGTTSSPGINRVSNNHEALCRAIEQHEAFRQEVSDAVRVLDEFITGSEDYKRGSRTDGVHLADGRSVKFARFIIAKPDPLAECLLELDLSEDEQEARHDAEWLVKTIEKRGGKIVWEGE